MATLTARRPFFLKNIYGHNPDIRGGAEMVGYKEDASQTYKAGDALILDATSGEVKIQADADNVAAILGIAIKPATGTTGATVLVHCFAPGDLWVMNYETSGSGAVTALALLGDGVEFNVDTGIMRCTTTGYGGNDFPFGTIYDIYATDNGYVRAEGVIGDTMGQVVVAIGFCIGLGRSL